MAGRNCGCRAALPTPAHSHALLNVSSPLPTHSLLSSPAAVAPADLEDRDAADSWTVGSRPQQERYTGGSRVGAFAAAAGRGATAFVEAFRSVVGNHRTTYNSRHSGGAHN